MVAEPRSLLCCMEGGHFLMERFRAKPTADNATSTRRIIST
jgi:hypothetical protein